MKPREPGEQPGEEVSNALPELLSFNACGGQQRNALRSMNLVLDGVVLLALTPPTSDPPAAC